MLLLHSIDSGIVRPTQDFLKEDTLKHIVQCYKTGNLEKVPPPPIVRKDADDSLVAIDGHNLLAVNYLLGKSTEVFIAKDSNDKYPGESEAIIKRNKDLNEKYDSAIVSSRELEIKGIKTIKDLVKYAGVDNLV